jgi:hypothetical protein
MARRHIIRPNPPPLLNPKKERRIERLKSKLRAAEASYDRWQRKFKRAFNAIDKLNRQMIRLQTLLRKENQS